MKKNINKPSHPKGQKSKEWPIVVYMWMFGLGLIGFLVGEFALSTQSHPYHWLLALIGGILGMGVGWLWYRWRGDVKI